MPPAKAKKAGGEKAVAAASSGVKAELEAVKAALEALKASSKAREEELVAKLSSTATAVDDLKGLLVRQRAQLEQHAEVREKGLRTELLKARDATRVAERRLAQVAGDAGIVATLENERLSLLTRLRSAEGERDRGARDHLTDMLALQSQASYVL